MAGARMAKLKTCRVCPTQFRPWTSTQIVCSAACAKVWGERQEAKKAEKARAEAKRREREDRRERKRRLMTRRDHLRIAQRHFNLWVRLRDANLGCVSCDLPATWQGQWHASHYRSIGACPELRFEPVNVHKACSACNNHKSGNIVEYRIRLVERIGQEALDWLEGPHELKQHSIDELQALARHYRAKARELKASVR